MKELHVLLALLALVLAPSARPATTPADPATVVLGTFDSRAVAVAWARSRAFADALHEQRVELDRAQAAGDADRVARLEAEGESLQDRLHGQAFGTAPVDDVLARIADRLQRLAREAGVDVIVSRWDVVHRGPLARTVDVTDRLTALFDPDRRTLEVIREVLASDPVLPEELGELPD